MTQFSDLALDPKVLQAISEAGYTTPTPIQAGAIPPALEGRDVLGIAQTGTGKTASFTLPMITLLGRGRARARMPRSLVLCPTRELAAQVAENFDTYASKTRLTKALLIGGVSMRDQELLINRGVDVLIATPGRLLDHFERGNLLLQGVQIMVVDEADRMLDMGFIPDIERIFQLTPFTRQTLFFSATMAPEIERITDTFLHAPVRIEVARQATTSDTITQKLVEITPTRKDQTAKQKRELLRAMIRAEEAAPDGLKNAMIFCNRKTEVDIVAKSLKAHGLDAAPIHGDLDQAQRMRTLDGFREGTLRFLVASDVAARGLDIPAVSHVFNFDLPSHAEDYVHRIGRTGRAGRQGTAISIATPSDEKYLAAIEGLVKHALPRAPAPEGFALSEAAREAPVPRREDREGRDRGSRARSRGIGRRGEDERRAETRPPAPMKPLEVVAVNNEPVVRNEDREDALRDEPRRDAEAVRSGERRDRRDSGRDSTRDERREPRRDERQDGGRAASRDERRDERKGNRDHGRDDRRDDRRGGASGVVGLGEHVPDFMNRAFRVGFKTATEVPEPVEPRAEVEASEPRPPRERDEARASGRNGRSRRGRGRDRQPRSADAPLPEVAVDVGVEDVIALEAEIEATVPEIIPATASDAAPLPDTLVAAETALPDSAGVLAAVTMPDNEVAPPSEPVLDEMAAPVAYDPDPPTDAPAKPRRVRAKAKPEGEAPAPKRSRKAKLIEAAPEAEAQPVEAEAPKPRRTRKPRPAAEAPAEPTEAPARPRRTRRKADPSVAADPSDAPSSDA